MFRSRSVASPRSVALVAARLCVIGATVVVSGCASKHAAYEPPARVAGPAPVPHGQWKVEIEEDGLPTQLGPRNPRATPDDPREPWSPNYGKAAPQKAAAIAEPSPAAHAPAMPKAAAALGGPSKSSQPVARQPAPARITEMDEEAIIRRAIAEHEMRRRD